LQGWLCALALCALQMCCKLCVGKLANVKRGNLRFAKGYLQRAGIADVGEFYIRPPEPLPGFLIKLNIKN